MRGAPQSGFSRLKVRIKTRISCGTPGRPHWPRRIFPVQKRRKPFRCQPITVAGWTRKMWDRQSFQTSHNQAHRSRSAGVSFGRLTERCRTPIWWRKARTSNCNAARLRKNTQTDAKSAEKRGPKENRRKNAKPQFINQFGIDENHSKEYFDPCRQTVCGGNGIAQPIHFDRPGANIPEFSNILWGDAEFISLLDKRAERLTRHAHERMATLYCPYEDIGVYQNPHQRSG